MNDRIDHLPTALSNFITERDNFVARFGAKQSGLIAVSTGGPMAFNDLLIGHSEMLAHLLPEMNLAQWEALSELTASRLNQMRMMLENK